MQVFFHLFSPLSRPHPPHHRRRRRLLAVLAVLALLDEVLNKLILRLSTAFFAQVLIPIMCHHLWTSTTDNTQGNIHARSVNREGMPVFGRASRKCHWELSREEV